MFFGICRHLFCYLGTNILNECAASSFQGRRESVLPRTLTSVY